MSLVIGHIRFVTSPESKRHDLYNGQVELIGAERAETVMAYLPSRGVADLATRADVTDLTARIDRVETGLARRIDRVESLMVDRFDQMNQRIDRIVLTVAAGLVAMIATLVTQSLL